jgi:hypothetical protein
LSSDKCVNCGEVIVIDGKFDVWIHQEKVDGSQRIYCSWYKPELKDLCPPPFASTVEASSDDWYKKEKQKKEKQKEKEKITRHAISYSHKSDEEKIRDVESVLDGKKRRFRVFVEQEWDGIIEAFTEEEAEDIVQNYLDEGVNAGRHEVRSDVGRVEEVDEDE